MKHVATVALALALASCGGAPKPACTTQAREALLTLYKHAVDELIASDRCDAYLQNFDQCPEYIALELHHSTVLTGMCSQ